MVSRNTPHTIDSSEHGRHSIALNSRGGIAPTASMLSFLLATSMPRIPPANAFIANWTKERDVPSFARDGFSQRRHSGANAPRRAVSLRSWQAFRPKRKVGKKLSPASAGRKKRRRRRRRRRRRSNYSAAPVYL